jgi:hypothetical protein
MSVQTKNTQLDSELTLWESSEFLIKIHALTIALTKEVHKVKDCRLTFQVTPEQYQLIDKQALFNLKPEIRTSLSGKPFQPSSNIQIEASLKPDLLPQLTKNAKTSKKATTYLQNISQEQPLHPLLSTSSWYALEVKQIQETGETSFHTMWNYLKLSDIKNGDIDSEKLSESVLNFTKYFINNNNSATSKDLISQPIEKINHSLENLHSNSDIQNAEIVDSKNKKQMNTEFSEIAESTFKINKEVDHKNSDYQTIINFFNREYWQFEESSDEPSLLLAFRGENGEWNCYARLIEEDKQFLFHSILPIQVPENKRTDVAEFIARANFGMAIGNFELDFSDGEINYKTSIDFEGSQLNFDLIRSLVYTNVMMMDEYLPGIMWVIQGEMEAEEAILRVEGLTTA